MNINIYRYEKGGGLKLGITERIQGCMAVERAASGIYEMFALRFPDDAGLWEKLALEELEHMQILALIEAYGPFEDDRSEMPALPSGDIISRTLTYLDNMESKLRVTALTREEAFEAALKIENNMVESYLNEHKELKRYEQTGHMNQMGRLLESERTHIDIITQHMNEQGVASYS